MRENQTAEAAIPPVSNDKKIELLSPAGSPEALRAAIHNGADAVYLGGKAFGARAASANFNYEELSEAIAYAHKRKVKVYVTVNTLLQDEELNDCLAYVGFLYAEGVDAIIVQDLALIEAVRRCFPDLELHASTQMTATNAWDVQYLTQLGIRRVVLARECSLDEVDAIHAASAADLELFVHGALCMSYSGMCYFSAFHYGRSANRGSCAQPCRMRYTQEDRPGDGERHFLSLMDLSLVRHLDTLKSHPVASLKIEGRMKRAEYVATVTRAYRTALDRDDLDDETKYKLEMEIASVFHRGYTKGFLLDAPQSEMRSLDKASNRGIPVAKVLKNDKKKRRLHLELTGDLYKGDGLSTGEKVGRILKRREIRDYAAAGEAIELDYIGDMQAGTVVYKTHDAALIERANESVKREYRRFPVQLEIVLRIGRAPELMLIDEEGRHFSSRLGDVVVETAQKRPLDEAFLFSRLDKFQDSVFFLDHLKVDMDAGAALSVSHLNRMRRDCIDQAEAARVRKRAVPLPSEFPMEEKLVIPSGASHVRIFCETREQIAAVASAKVPNVLICVRPDLLETALAHFGEDAASIQWPHIIDETGKEALVESLLALPGKPVISAPSLAALCEGRDVIADATINAYNCRTIALLARHMYVHVSMEWFLEQREEKLYVLECKDRVEIPLYVHPVLMVTKHLLEQDRGIHSLEGIQGDRYALRPDGNHTQLIDTQAWINPRYDEFKEQGFTSFYLSFLEEKKEDCLQILRRFSLTD